MDAHERALLEASLTAQQAYVDAVLPRFTRELEAALLAEGRTEYVGSPCRRIWTRTMDPSTTPTKADSSTVAQRKRYRRLCRKLHPDTNGDGSDGLFKTLRDLHDAHDWDQIERLCRLILPLPRGADLAAVAASEYLRLWKARLDATYGQAPWTYATGDTFTRQWTLDHWMTPDAATAESTAYYESENERLQHEIADLNRRNDALRSSLPAERL
jgi:hypothetical protein